MIAALVLLLAFMAAGQAAIDAPWRPELCRFYHTEVEVMGRFMPGRDVWSQCPSLAEERR